MAQSYINFEASGLGFRVLKAQKSHLFLFFGSFVFQASGLQLEWVHGWFSDGRDVGRV